MTSSALITAKRLEIKVRSQRQKARELKEANELAAQTSQSPDSSSEIVSTPVTSTAADEGSKILHTDSPKFENSARKRNPKKR